MSITPDPIEELKKRFPNIRDDEPLAQHSFFKVGGNARYYVQPSTSLEQRSIISEAIKLGVRFIVIGAGANILISDKGFPDLVIRNGGRTCQRLDRTRILADAGVPLGSFMNFVAQAGLRGAEYLAGIPGSIGGAIFGNAGGRDYATAQCVESVHWIDADGSTRESDVQDCLFEYRSSRFKKIGGWIVDGIFKFEPGDPVLIRTAIEENIKRKRSVQPLGEASAGCVFKNPPGLSVGKLIDEAGLKGKRIGGAEVSALHGNFIVNKGDATAEDIVILISYIKQQIRDRYHVQLQEEIRYIGFD